MKWKDESKFSKSKRKYWVRAQGDIAERWKGSGPKPETRSEKRRDRLARGILGIKKNA